MPTFTEVTDEDLRKMRPFSRHFKGPDTAETPFRPAIECTLDIPVPPSVNKTRRIDWANHRKHQEWRKQAGMHLMEVGQFRSRLRNVQRYELTIVLDENQVEIDPDNAVKACGDFLKTMNVIVDDAPQNARRIEIVWGTAPAGVRLILRPCA